MSFKRLLPKIENYEEFSLFTAAHLFIHTNSNKSELLKSTKFVNNVIKDLEDFIDTGSFSIERIEKRFDIGICVLKNAEIRKNDRLLISHIPSQWRRVMWLEDSRDVKFKCKKCVCSSITCTMCESKFRSEIYLLTEINKKRIQGAISKLKTVQVSDFREALKVTGIECNQYEVFTRKRLRYLERKYEINCHLYDAERLIREPMGKQFQKTIYLKKTQYPDVSEEILCFHVIVAESELPKNFVCSFSDECRATFAKKCDLDEHIKKCPEIQKKLDRVDVVQRTYGDSKDIITRMIDLKFLPDEALEFENSKFACFDIETLECLTGETDLEDVEGLVEVAKLNLVSIAVGSNFPDYKSKCFVRRTSKYEDELFLVESFLDYLEEIAALKVANLPAFVEEAERNIYESFEKLKKEKGSKFQYQELYSFQSVIRNWKTLDVFGFNSSKFDIPVIAAPLFHLLLSRNDKPEVMKRGASYFTVKTRDLRFKDVLNYTAPCSYDKFLKSWDSPLEKSIFPYSYYGQIEEMRISTDFPPFEAFKNELNPNNSPTFAEYDTAKKVFYQKKMENMSDWLRYYNELDVYPLVIAIENCFASYRHYFNVRPFLAFSLPSMAEKAMFNFVDKDQPLVFSPNEKERSVHEQYRNNVLGGLVNVYKRHVVTTDEIDCPKLARHAPNGDPYSSFIMLDFTSMYLSTQLKPMPCGPALIWEKSSEKVLKKKISIPNHSFIAQQWLCYRQETGESKQIAM